MENIIFNPVRCLLPNQGKHALERNLPGITPYGPQRKETEDYKYLYMSNLSQLFSREQL